MGTAFGLDASLMPSEHPGEAAGARSGESEESTWERRLVRRGKA
jgi:hypothetical protein